jgi:BMFP domain-containing protein YqiC
MFNSKFLEDLSSRLSSLVPLAGDAQAEFRTKIEQLLKSSFANMDLLTREEFDAQRSALERAEKRVNELEVSIAELSNKLDIIEQQSAND